MNSLDLNRDDRPPPMFVDPPSGPPIPTHRRIKTPFVGRTRSGVEGLVTDYKIVSHGFDRRSSWEYTGFQLDDGTLWHCADPEVVLTFEEVLQACLESLERKA